MTDTDMQALDTALNRIVRTACDALGFDSDDVLENAVIIRDLFKQLERQRDGYRAVGERLAGEQRIPIAEVREMLDEAGYRGIKFIKGSAGASPPYAADDILKEHGYEVSDE